VDLLQRLATNAVANLHLFATFAAFWLIDTLAQRRLRSTGRDADAISGLSMWVGVGALAGARLVYLLPNAGSVLRHPVDVLQINSGLSWYGAQLGATTALLLYRRIRGVSFFAVADAYALFLPLGIAAFRLTCLLHSPCWGSATDTALGIHFPDLTVPRYPSELYEGFMALGLFAVLLQISLRKLSPGLLTGVSLTGYAMVRWITDLTRIHVGFWSKADPWLALVMGLVGVAVLAVAWSRGASAGESDQPLASRKPSPGRTRRWNAT
jgi:phosphatidylglycerol:prolipoprotein diacylglycerol transferase